jgi:hypothetical protein
VPSLTDAALPTETIGTGNADAPQPSARMVYRHVVWLEAKASAVAISVMFILALLGRDEGFKGFAAIIDGGDLSSVAIQRMTGIGAFETLVVLMANAC